MTILGAVGTSLLIILGFCVTASWEWPYFGYRTHSLVWSSSKRRFSSLLFLHFCCVFRNTSAFRSDFLICFIINEKLKSSSLWSILGEIHKNCVYVTSLHTNASHFLLCNLFKGLWSLRIFVYSMLACVLYGNIISMNLQEQDSLFYYSSDLTPFNSCIKTFLRS